MKVSIIQNSVLETKEKTFVRIASLADKIKRTDMILLPEYFATGCSCCLF